MGLIAGYFFQETLVKQFRIFAGMVAVVVTVAAPAAAQRRPAPPPSRYTYTFEIDKKSLPKGVSVRTVGDKSATRHFLKNTGDKPLIINERYQGKTLVTGTKLVDGQVFQYFPNGVPMEGKTHLKGWQAPFGVIKETLLYLPKEPAKIYEGRKPGLPKTLPPDEPGVIAAKYDGKPLVIKITIRYHLNPAYDKPGR